MAQGLYRRPLAADALVLATPGHPAEPLDRRRPAGPQLPESLPQVGRIGRADQQPHWMPPVKLGFDVRRHFDSVDHQVADQPVDDGVLHHHPDQTSAGQIALAELGISQVLVLEARHAGQYLPTYRQQPAPDARTASRNSGSDELSRRTGSHQTRHENALGLLVMAANLAAPVLPVPMSTLVA